MIKAEPQKDCRGVFATTHWSVVLTAGPNDNTAASTAWESLAKCYWYPVYAHVRRRVSCPHEAQDLVQEFFATLLRRESLASVGPEKGRFRTFLLTSLKYFLSDQFQRASAGKRGGGQPVISFDAMEAEERLRFEPATNNSPDREFDRRWAAALIERALNRLQTEQTATGRAALFACLKEFLAREVEPGEYDPIAGQFNLTANAIAATVRRLRLRLRELAAEEAMQTTATMTDVEDELRQLFG
ncbi:MAG: sigma-70 family RNA polymerase sigma factor [Akkermansiaceae bacterium]|nr:sigma-70 family RNA polymerase sigma factor [Verrucomicrobiales bacterium]